MSRIWFIVSILSLLVAPFAFAPTSIPATAAEVPIRLSTVTELPLVGESEPNGSITPPGVTAQPIAVGRTDSWRQPIEGVIASSSDIDYFAFTIDAPGSLVTVTLTNLQADYDLVFGGGVDPVTGQGGATESFEFDPGKSGLEDVTQIGGQITSIGGQITSIGGQITSIGGQITSIGGQITSIGGQITSIGGQITSIGGQITSISVNPGTRDEQIETVVWQPGRYFVAVAPASAGVTSPTPYRLTITLSRSTLQPLGPAPHVQVLTDVPDPDVTTLYIINSARMQEVYPDELSSISVISSSLQNYTSQVTLVWGGYENPLIQEKGAVIDLADLTVVTGSGATPLSQLLQDWVQPGNQRNPLYANYLAGIIDHVIEAMIDPAGNGRSGEVRLDYQIAVNNNFSPGDEDVLATPYPNVRNIVLIGSDEVIPFFRLPDLTTLANEAEYLEYLKTIDSNSGGNSLISPDNPLGAALRNRMLLSDNPYGTDRPYRFYGFPLFVPDLAVGRIVERPSEIADFLRRNVPWSDSAIDLRADSFYTPTLSLAGYDFLIDETTVISNTIGQATTNSIDKRLLLTNTWDRTAFENGWLEQPLESTGFFTTTLDPYTRTQTLLSSLNAHFDHWQLIPAETHGTDPNFPAERILAVQYGSVSLSCDYYPWDCPGFFYNTIYYSVGCHSGYNVPYNAILQSPATIPVSRYAADFPQAFNRHAGNWIGNTGYGYGTLDGVDYSERLAVLLTQELLRNETRPDSGASEGFTYVGRSIGEALVNAKVRYLRTTFGLNAYDYKVLSITTLYGLPWKRVFVDNPLNAPVEDLNAELPNNDRTAPEPIGSSQLTRTITFTINYDPNYLQHSRTGSVVRLRASNVTISDTFLLNSTFNITPTVTVFDYNQIGMPSLPAFAYDITALSGSDDDDNRVPLVVRDVIFRGGQYNTVDNFNPTVTQIVTETFEPLITTTIEPDFSAGIGFWLPDRFFGHSRLGDGADQRDTLISTAAVFRTTDGVTGTLRTYTQLVFQVIYTDPAASGAETALADQNPPVIERVRIAGQDIIPQSVSTPVEVVISDPDHPTNPQVTVTAVYLADDNVTWTPLTFTQDTTDRRLWRALVPRNWPDVRLIITAVDQAGNSVMYTAKGLLAPPTYQVMLPVVIRSSASSSGLLPCSMTIVNENCTNS
ncbi:MAG: peptidase [Chloroflexus sp.]|uniref:peptidase n=1 Tax=Chloroflexus sp. TaxID=1904827 RepID=UPI0021DB8DB0|nr:peptidase [Chloroflexus sp.]GIV90985.1 MAG: peptidase [Chloroflexus sp.]